MVGVIGIRYLEFITLDFSEFTSNQLTIMTDLAVVLIFVDISEAVAVDDADGITFFNELQRLIDVLHLVIMRMGRAIRGHESVDAEWSVVRLIAKVSAIGIIAVALEALIHPVPDGSATDTAVGIDHIPVLLQIAHRVTHGMSIFAHHKRLVCDSLRILTQIVRIEITVVPDGRVTSIAIVERRTGGVEFTYLIIHRLDIRSYSTLVAQTPEDDAGVIEITLHQ